MLSGVKGIAIVSFGRILYCMVLRLLGVDDWTIFDYWTCFLLEINTSYY